MKKFLLVIAVLVMSATAYAADTLTTFGCMESIYVYQGREYVGPFFRGWKSFTGTFPYLVPAESIHYVSPTHSAMLQGITSNLSGMKNILKVPSVQGPGTYQIHLTAKVKRVTLISYLPFNYACFIKGVCADSNPGGVTTWVGVGRDTINDTLWHTIDKDLLTIVLKTGDSLRTTDTLSVLQVDAFSQQFDTVCVDEVYLTGTFTINGVEGDGPVKKAVPVSGLRPGIYDLLGRRVDLMEHSGIYFVVGRDGSRTKVVHFR